MEPARASQSVEDKPEVVKYIDETKEDLKTFWKVFDFIFATYRMKTDMTREEWFGMWKDQKDIFEWLLVDYPFIEA